MGFRCFHLRKWCLINLVDQELLSLFQVHQVGTFPFKPQTFPPSVTSPTGHKHETPSKFHKPHTGKKVGCKSYSCSYTVCVQKNIKQKASPNFVLNLPFCYSSGQKFASHQCLAPPFLAREELAPQVFHSPADPFTATQADRPIISHPAQHPSYTMLPANREAKHAVPTVPHPLCTGLAGPTSRHTSSVQWREISTIVGKISQVLLHLPVK